MSSINHEHLRHLKVQSTDLLGENLCRISDETESAMAITLENIFLNIFRFLDFFSFFLIEKYCNICFNIIYLFIGIPTSQYFDILYHIITHDFANKCTGSAFQQPTHFYFMTAL